MSTQLTLSLPLPTSFRSIDILAFHRRDVQEIAEKVFEASFEKGMVWRNAPARLSVHFKTGHTEARLSIDNPAPHGSQSAFAAMVHRMLGLPQPIETFFAHYRHHPELGSLIAQRPGLRVPVTATPFEALTWAITGQQISVQAAVSLRRKLILAANIRHSSGLFCYPTAEQVAGLSEETLRQAGFSSAKTRTLLTVAQLAVRGELPLDAWAEQFPSVDLIQTQLQAIHGIGPWTVNYTLLRGFGWLDGSLHGDIAVRRSLQALLRSPDKINDKAAQHWLAQFSPWRALVGAHLWAAQSENAY